MRGTQRRCLTTVWVAGLASCLVALAPVSMGASADGGHAAAQAAASSPWKGTIKVEWTYDDIGCEGCVSSHSIDTGSLTYTLTSGSLSQTGSGWGYYTALGNGSGSIDDEQVSEWGTDTCLASWTASNVENPNIGLSSVAPIVSVPSVSVTPTRTGNACYASGDVEVVGNVPGLGWEQTIPDNDPTPERWTGTSTFRGTDPDGDINGEMRFYVYTVTVDLTRDPRLATKISAAALAAGYCLPKRCVADKIRVTGAISPAIRVPVTVRMRSQKKGKWVLDGTRSLTTSRKGSFSTVFGKPKGTPCRVDVSFSGNKKYAPSTWTNYLNC